MPHIPHRAVGGAQGIKELITALQSRGIAVYLISGGFRELTLPIARELGVHADNVFANRMNWQVGAPPRRRCGPRPLCAVPCEWSPSCDLCTNICDTCPSCDLCPKICDTCPSCGLCPKICDTCPSCDLCPKICDTCLARRPSAVF